MTRTTTAQYNPDTVKALLAKSKEGFTGAVRCELQEAPLVVLLEQGRVRDLIVEGHDTLELAFSELLDHASYRKASKRAAREGGTVGEAALRHGLVQEQAAVEAVLTFASSCCANALSLAPEKVSFDTQPAYEGPMSDLGANYDISLPLEELLLSALADYNAWDFVVENFPCVRNVYYATPKAVQFFREGQCAGPEAALLGAIDGRRDLAEAISASGLDPFAAMGVLQALAERGAVELVNPVQLFQLAVEEEEEGNWQKALHLYRQALRNGLDDFDLQFRLAEALRRTGNNAEAVQRYCRFAARCVEEFRFHDAARALKEVVALDPENVRERTRYMELLIRCERKTEAARQALALGELLLRKGWTDAARDVLGKAFSIAPEDPEYYRSVASLLEQCGARSESRKAAEEAERLCAEKADSEKALGYYRRRFVEGEDTVQVRKKLVDLYSAQGDTQRALEHLDALLVPGNPYGIAEKDTLRELHRTRCRLRPSDRDSAWFLIEDARSRGDDREAQALLRELIAALDPKRDRNELLWALKRLTQFDPQAREPYRQLAKLYAEAGEAEKAAGALWSFARMAKEQGHAEEARNALAESLALHPFDLRARGELLAVTSGIGDAHGARYHRLALALLEAVSGGFDSVKRLIEEGPFNATEQAVLQLVLAEASAACGRCDLAGEHFLSSGRLSLKERNFGLARTCLQRMKALGVLSPECSRFERELSEAGRERSGRGEAGTTERGDEAFCAVKQRVVKSSVTAITARLKNLKVGKPLGPKGQQGTAPEASQGGSGRTVSVAKAIGKLRAMAGKEKSSQRTSSETQVSSSSKGEISRAADRLKNLTSQGSQQAQERPEGAAEEEKQTEPAEPQAPSGGTKKAALNAAAARLAKLRKG